MEHVHRGSNFLHLDKTGPLGNLFNIILRLHDGIALRLGCRDRIQVCVEDNLASMLFVGPARISDGVGAGDGSSLGLLPFNGCILPVLKHTRAAMIP